MRIKNNMNTWDKMDVLVDELGETELLNSIGKWMGDWELDDALNSIAKDFEMFTDEEEDEEDEEEEEDD